MLFLTLNCTSKGDRRFHPGVLKIKIMGETDTIDNFFNKSLRNSLGEPCGFDGADHFTFGGCDFPLELCESFYLSLWLQRLAGDKFLQDELKKYGDFFDGRDDGVNSHARAFRLYCQGGLEFLKAASSKFLSAYGKARKNAETEQERGEGELPPAQFPDFSYVVQRAQEYASVILGREGHDKGMCSKFVLKDFGFPNSKDISVYDREKLHNIIGAMVGAYYDLACGNVNNGYITSCINECSGTFREIKASYKTE